MPRRAKDCFIDISKQIIFVGKPKKLIEKHQSEICKHFVDHI